jgi:hypothetical protein
MPRKNKSALVRSKKITRVKSPPKVSENRQQFSRLLDEVLEILEKISSRTESSDNLNNFTTLGLDLFSKIFEIGSCFGDSFKKLVILEKVKQVNNQIKVLLVNISGWVKNFLVQFPHIFLTEKYTPATVCMVRSGIKFLFDLWGNFMFRRKKINIILDPLGRGIKEIDKILQRWVENPDNRVIDRPKGIPTSHWWYI